MGRTTTRATVSSTTTADRFTVIRDRTLSDLIFELDGVYDTLMGQALNEGDNGRFELASTVKMASDLLYDLRLSAPPRD